MKQQAWLWSVVAMGVMGGVLSQPAQGQNTDYAAQVRVSAVGKATPLSAAEQKLLGKHKFSLQWISWERFGVAEIKRGRNGLEMRAKQELNGDWVTAKGMIEVVDDKTFYFTGEIITKIHHINNGQPCERSGTFEFRATGKRQYWRMQQMQNPCSDVVDYIDVYFR